MGNLKEAVLNGFPKSYDYLLEKSEFRPRHDASLKAVLLEQAITVNSNLAGL